MIPISQFSLPIILGLIVLFPINVSTAAAQEDAVLLPDENPATNAVMQTPENVDVAPLATDEDISTRLASIFDATGWFENVHIETDDGVVFLKGTADTETHREWAENVANRTSDVVAVVNQFSVRSRPVWDFQPAWTQLQQLGRDAVQLIPLLVVGIVVLLLAYLVSKIAAIIARSLTARRIESQLLKQVAASVTTVLVMLVGLYVALKISGLSRLAVTVLGGTGLVGLAFGFAFRDIAENYLASVLISLNRPFRVGDLIELEGIRGFVRRVTTRGTLLLTLEGNHVQIPNNHVYKATITNYSSSPRIRKDFLIGIGYDDSISNAQEIIHRTLRGHESVLGDPEPLVLVESLGASTVNLRVLFWLDGERFDALSVSSALMRQTKAALMDANISMPDESREVIFPSGVPVHMLDAADSSSDGKLATESPATHPDPDILHDDQVESNKAEGGLANSDITIQRLAESGEDLDATNLID